MEWWHWPLFVLGHSITWFFVALLPTVLAIGIASILVGRIWHGSHELSSRAARNPYCWIGVIALSAVGYVLLLKYGVVE